MSDLPAGTVTFLFTDLEGSTRLWEQHPDGMKSALAGHDAIVREAIETHGGHVVKTTGDGFHAVFATAHDAVGAAVAAQLSLGEEPWAETGPLRVRMGLHTCEAELRDGDYYGNAVNRAARLMGVAHGGQVVVSAVTGELVRDGSVELVDLGDHRLRDLGHAERVFQVAHPDLPREFPPLQSVDVLPGNLPVQPNRFVGRAALIDQVRGLLADTAVVTLTGPGGVGKTRLAVQVAAEVQPEFPDGVWFVDLAPVNTEERVTAVLLETLGYTLAAGEDAVDGLCARLRRRELLLVVDNCEHLVASVATVANAVAARAPDVRVVATSREGLGIPAERVLPVAPLATDADGDAVELFAARARAARPDFALDDDTLATVVELCRRLDGIPLAIELAAARTRAIAPGKILERLDERFRVLTGGSRTAVPRHQTLQAAVDWSYDLLSEPERTVLDRLSVFAGGFALDAAEAVAADDAIDALDVLDHLGALVEKSLVVADPDGDTYRLLETIRQYASARLAESGTADEVRARHASHYRSVAAAVAPELVGPGDLAALDRLAAEVENFRLMLDWYHERGRGDVVVDALWELGPFWQWARSIEMIGLLDRELAVLADDPVRLSRVHAQLAHLTTMVGYAGGRVHAEKSMALAARAGVTTPALAHIALASHIMTIDGDTERAIAQTEQAREAERAAGDPAGATMALSHRLYYTALRAPGTEATLRLVEEVRREAEDAGNALKWGLWLGGAAIAFAPIDPERALDLLEEQIELTGRTGFGDFQASAEFFAGLVRFRLRRYADAAASLRRALARAHDLGHRRAMFNALSAAVGLAARTGHPEAAAMLLIGLRAAREEYGIPGSSVERDAEETLWTRLGPGSATDRARDPIRQRGVESTIDLALDTLDEIAAEEGAG